MIRTKESEEKAEKAALKALLDLTKESPKIYNSPNVVGRRFPKDNSYGKITPDDVTNLLEKYVSMDLVTCIPTRQTNGRICKSYIANPEKISEIEKIINS